MSLYALVRKPKVFKVGCGLVPVTDWVANYEHLPANAIDRLFGCKLEENPELWKDRSPVTHIKNIQAPVLIKAGANDSRCPLQPIRDFVAILKEMNHPHQYIEVGDEGHNAGLVNRDDRATDFMQILQFLQQYL